jgi:hypothetical protein
MPLKVLLRRPSSSSASTSTGVVTVLTVWVRSPSAHDSRPAESASRSCLLSDSRRCCSRCTGRVTERVMITASATATSTLRIAAIRIERLVAEIALEAFWPSPAA